MSTNRKHVEAQVCARLGRERFRILFDSAEVIGFYSRSESLIRPDAFVTVIAVGEITDQVGDVFPDLRAVAKRDFALPSDR